MTNLTVAARNYLVQDLSFVTDLKVRRTQIWPEGWIFPDVPWGPIENTQKCMLVLTQSGGWQPPSDTNTVTFPRLNVDIWADPTRNPDGSVMVDDTTEKIVNIVQRLKRSLHTINLSAPNGMPWRWGTPEQVAAGTALVVLSSQQLTEPVFNPVRDGNGAVMGSVSYGVIVA